MEQKKNTSRLNDGKSCENALKIGKSSLAIRRRRTYNIIRNGHNTTLDQIYIQEEKNQ